MNIDELRRKLIGVARRDAPSDQVPFAFEQRVMARLRSAPAVDEWLSWVRAFWWGAGACAAIALTVGAWITVFQGDDDSGARFAHDLEQTILASTDDGDSTW